MCNKHTTTAQQGKEHERSQRVVGYRSNAPPATTTTPFPGAPDIANSARCILHVCLCPPPPFSVLMLPFPGMIGFPPALSYDIYRLCCLALFPDGPFGDPGGVRDDIYTTDCRRPLTTSNQIVHQTRTHTDKRGTVALEEEPRRAERAHFPPIQRNCFFHSQTFPPTHQLLDPTQR